MSGKRLMIIAAVAVVLGGYIFFIERHQPTTEELRKQESKVFPGIDRETVIALELVNPSGTFRFERRDQDWFIAQPIDSTADAAAIGGVLTSLLGLESERKLSRGEIDEQDYARYGLDEPGIRVTLVLEDGDEHQLLVGGETALGSNRAVRRDDKEILLCSKWFAEDLERDLNGWRSKEVVQVYPDQVASFEILSGDERVHAVRVGETWQLLEPVQDVADRDHVRDLISGLNSIEVKEFIDSEANLAELGLEGPRHRVTIVKTTGEAPMTLEMGQTRHGDGGEQVACRRDGKDLLWVSAQAEGALGRAPVRWRATEVFPFDTWDVERLEIRSSDDELIVERRQGVWQVLGSPEGDQPEEAEVEIVLGEADSGAVLDRLSAIAGLEAVEYDLVDAGAPELGSIAMTFSTSATSASPADGAGSTPSSVELRLMAPLGPGGNALVTASGRDTVMSVGSEAAAQVLSGLDALRGDSGQPEKGSETPGDAPGANQSGADEG